MGRRNVSGKPTVRGRMEHDISQNQQAAGTAFSSDIIYTADDLVTLKRIIWDIGWAMGSVATAGSGMWFVFLVPKDVTTPTLVLTDGDLFAESLMLLCAPIQWQATSDGNMERDHYDSKFNKRLQPGDKILVGRVITGDNLLVAAKECVHLMLQHGS